MSASGDGPRAVRRLKAVGLVIGATVALVAGVALVGVALSLGWYSPVFTVEDLASDAWYDELARDFWLGPTFLKWFAGACSLFVGYIGGALVLGGYGTLADALPGRAEGRPSFAARTGQAVARRRR